jgi:hypothetical protein
VHYLEEWRAFSAHIEGLKTAAGLNVQYGISADGYGRTKRLGEHCKRLLANLREFRTRFGTVLPRLVVSRLDEFFKDDGPVIEKAYGREDDAIPHSIVVLVALAGELEQLLSDQQQILRSRTELAFAHLQRLIIVDPDVKKKWTEAFDGSGESACEALGSVHLLWHQILAFKIDAKGARTDLVFPEPLSSELHARSSVALVLTEWKVASDEKIAQQRFGEAHRQADLYRQGVLATAELTNTRYLIVVSKKQVRTPDDDLAGGVTYRHVNIAIDPDTPSVAAKQKPAP